MENKLVLSNKVLLVRLVGKQFAFIFRKYRYKHSKEMIGYIGKIKS